MMERNEETLSTRDLASPNDPAATSSAAVAGGSAETAPDSAVAFTGAGGSEPGAVRASAPGEADLEVHQIQPGEGIEDAPAQSVPAETGSAPQQAVPAETGSAPQQAVPAETGSAPQQAVPAETDSAPQQAVPAETDSAPQQAVAGQGDSAPGLAAGEPTPAQSSGVTTGSNDRLLAADISATFQRHWEDVQTQFVDDPRGAVEDADRLVANVMQQLAEGFAQERERLEAQWGRGEDISTEDLRVSMQRYRSFFQRLLST